MSSTVQILEHLNKTATKELERLNAELKSDEVVVLVPVKFKLNKEKTDIIGSDGIDVNKYKLSVAIEKQLSTCPICGNHVYSCTPRITDEVGQRYHLECYHKKKQ